MSERYEALMDFLLTELSQPTLAAIKAAADKRFDAITRVVLAHPTFPTGAIEGVLEDFLHRVDDYLPEVSP